ncbi:MAG: CDP-alcohol phosphatidyltransferase family protein [Thermoleophilaceae bacterium]|nr:CDP-alcohol phosphatidyltransferase family protein [Thermoleophilaceae bacterium]
MEDGVSRRRLPPLPELIAICGGEGTGDRDEPRDLRRIYARGVRKLSIRITRVLLPTGITANQTTVFGILIGIAGGLLLGVNEFWAQILAIVLLELAFVLDFCDGEIARFERTIEGRSSGAGGAYLDWVGHYYMPAAMAAGLGWAVFHETGDWWWLAAALIVILSLVRVPYSARDHIMWGVYRDKPELRDSEPMVRAAMARMGGDPEALNLEASGAEAMAGGSGRGWLWSRYTNFGQLIVFPGFINLVAAASIIDMLISWLAWDDDYVASVWARGVLLALLGAVHLLHQIRAIAQGFRVTRALE